MDYSLIKITDLPGLRTWYEVRGKAFPVALQEAAEHKQAGWAHKQLPLDLERGVVHVEFGSLTQGWAGKIPRRCVVEITKALGKKMS